jgi:TctA family transporter
MDPVFSAAIEGLSLIFSWPNILYPILGTLLAMLFSILPGVSGVTLMTLVIPFTLFWSPLEIMLLFGALVGGATFMGSITAILINVPGRTSSAATMLDGYPLSQQGKAKTAIACSATASALGSTFGVIVLIAIIPFMIPLVLAFGPLELLTAIIWGLSTIAFVVRGSWLKGLIMAGLGLALSFIGTDQQTAESRFTFDFLYLLDGLPAILVFLGIFAIAEMLQLLLTAKHTISGHRTPARLGGSITEGIKSVFTHFPLFLRCSFIGTIVGMMPGVGSVVSSFVAYGHAAQSKDGCFGKGDIRGVLAPEAANDAKDGGSLVPTLAFGIPGGLGTAMLLTAFTLHGINPGRDLLNDQLSLVFVLIWSLFFSNWLTSILGLAGVNWFAKLTTMPTRFLIPGVLVIVALSSYSYRASVNDALLVMGFGVLGFIFKRLNWPRAPFVIALVLGPYFENSLHLSLQLHKLGRLDVGAHPVALFLLSLTFISLLIPWWRSRKMESTIKKVSDNSIMFSSLLILIVAAMLSQLNELSSAASLAPWVVLSSTLCLLLAHTYINAREFTSGLKTLSIDFQPVAAMSSALSIFVLTWLTGPLIAVILFLACYCYFRLAFRAKTTLVWILAGGWTAYALVHIVLARSFEGGWLWSVTSLGN